MYMKQGPQVTLQAERAWFSIESAIAAQRLHREVLSNFSSRQVSMFSKFSTIKRIENI